ncbi:MAG: thiamine-phosphate kinase [Porphyromonadaceae bacterium]|nr:MAG: thiamine-phosphate kinase [Porphyromonadaceae bacterium]
MADKKTRTLSELGEFGLIRALTDDIILRHPGSRKGIGDDAAVLDHNGFLTLVTTDLLLEGIHFDLTYVPLKHLGYKSVVVNLSDIYAMNGTPLQVTVSIGVSSKLSLNAIEEFYKGIKLACNQYEIDLIGGDTSASVNGLIISVTALGTAQPQQIVYRKGAKKGDLICVTGDLGGAYMGLMLLEQENKLFRKDPAYKPQLDGYQYILERQLKPEARKDLGRMLLAGRVKPTSMIDVSDGLSSDLLHICEASGTGSRIFADRIPVHSETRKLAEQLRISPNVATLNGGEDYELLFTVAHEDFARIQLIEGISIIGMMTGREDGHLVEFEDKSTILMEAQGWNAKQKWEEL